MQTIDMAVKDIRPYENNPRRNDDAVDKVANSIKEFGWQQPIVVDKDGVIIVGHTRYKAAKKLKLKTVPVVVADLSEEQAKAYRIADNSTGEIATWDYDKLMQELEGIDYDMGQFGLEIEEQYIETTEMPEIEEDEPPRIPDEPTTIRGQIFRLGNHVLMCGDTTNADDVAKLMKAAGLGGGDRLIDMIMTDPPYNVAIEGHTKDKLTIENDDMTEDQFRAFLSKAFNNMAEYLKDGGAFYIWHSSKTTREFMDACKEAGLDVKQTLVWIKSMFVLGRQDYQWRQEPCLYGWKEGASHYFIPIRNLTTVEEESINIDGMTEKEVRDALKKILGETPTDAIKDTKPVASREHPTMKPVTLMARLIFNSSHPNDTVMDLFGGSGSTMMACEQLHRKCIMMEYDPKYCDVIVKRWENLTGKQAEVIA